MKRIFLVAALLGSLGFGATTASANVGAGAAFDAHYVSNSSCTSCHSGGPGTLYQLGFDWKTSGGTNNAGPSTQAGWDALDAKYSTTYGGVDPNWTLGATPTVTQGEASVTGCITSSLQMPLMLFAGLLALGFFSRRKKV